MSHQILSLISTLSYHSMTFTPRATFRKKSQAMSDRVGMLRARQWPGSGTRTRTAARKEAKALGAADIPVERGRSRRPKKRGTSKYDMKNHCACAITDGRNKEDWMDFRRDNRADHHCSRRPVGGRVSWQSMHKICTLRSS